MTTTFENLPMVMPADWVKGPKQGSWTYDDYVALEDGQRYEIVNGVLLMTPAPSWLHQEIVGAFYRYLYAHVTATGLGGAFVAPVDVELAVNIVFQPDVVVLLKRSREKLREKHIVGAPDLVIEVASPGTAMMDRLTKYDTYAQAGVPEYWIVRPENHRALRCWYWTGRRTVRSVYSRGRQLCLHSSCRGFWCRLSSSLFRFGRNNKRKGFRYRS